MWLFIIYSFFGWCLEVIYQAVELGKFINRGFLNGPYCPIYGFGAIIVIISLCPISENIIVLYIGSVLLTSLLELVTGFLLEKIFNQHWWDYSEEKFNIGGYICLKFSLLWGVACVFVIRLINPPIENFVNIIPHKAGIAMLIIFYIGFISDFAFTVSAILNIKKKLRILESISVEMRKISDKTGEKLFNGVENILDKGEELHVKERMEELHKNYQQIIEKRSLTGKRLENAFPKLKAVSVKSFKERLEEIKNRKND